MSQPISFREIDLADAELLLDWRTKERVTRFMNTDVCRDIEAQKGWLSTCYKQESYYHWIIQLDDDPIGFISLVDYSAVDRISSWGFYIGSDDALGYGAFIPPYFYNWAFTKLQIDEIKAECFYNNSSVIGLHLLHGYRFTPAADRVIRKNGKEILLVAMSLRKENWNHKRYAKLSAPFPVTRWDCAPRALRD